MYMFYCIINFFFQSKNAPIHIEIPINIYQNLKLSLTDICPDLIHIHTSINTQLCYLLEGRMLLLNTRNNSGGSPSLGTSSPTVWNGSKRSGNFSRVANSGLARMSVASPSQIVCKSLEDSCVTQHGRKSVASHS